MLLRGGIHDETLLVTIINAHFVVTRLLPHFSTFVIIDWTQIVLRILAIEQLNYLLKLFIHFIIFYYH